MTSDVLQQAAGFVTPGTLLRGAREVQQLREREVAEQLNLMPGYVDILERDDYQSLRSPAFARGYVKAYGRLLGLDEAELLQTFDEHRATLDEQRKHCVTPQPLQLQRTGLGVVVGLTVLALLVLALWWWRGAVDAPKTAANQIETGNSVQALIDTTLHKEVDNEIESGAAEPLAVGEQ